MRLSKRRAKAGAQSTTNAVLVCKHRDMNEKELEAQVSVLVTFPLLLSVKLNMNFSFRYLYHLLGCTCCWKENFRLGIVTDLLLLSSYLTAVYFNTSISI